MNACAARCFAIATALLFGGCTHVARPPTQPGVPELLPSEQYEVIKGRTADVIARLRAAPAPAQPEVSDGHSPPGDETVLRAQGFVQIGIGHFAERDVSRARDRAEKLGREVGAEKVLLYSAADAAELALTATYYVRLHLPFGADFRDMTEQEREALGSTGVQIGEVVGGTPAARANLRDGDFVLKFNHAPVQDKAAFQALLQAKMGHRVTLTIRRDGATIERSVRLETLAEPDKH
jgi:hypothetical protein